MYKIKKESIEKNKYNILLMIFYSITTLILVLLHENWRDEAQSWLIARDLNFIDIFKQLKYEGHPCLWYLILFPFAKLGFPYITENLISWLIMNITAWIIIKKAPFSTYIKFLILLTSPFIYLYPVIARSYCLIPLAIVLIAITYKNRKTQPIKYVLSILFLAHTHVIMLGLVGMLFLFFFFEELFIKFKEKNKEEKKKIIISLLISVIGLIMLFLQLFGSLQSNKNINSNIIINTDTIGVMYNEIFEILKMLFWEVLAKPLFLVLMLLLIYEFIKHTKNAIIILVSIFFQICVYTFIYPVSGQRAGTVMLIIMLFLWIQSEENRSKAETTKNELIFEVIFLILLVFNIATSVQMIEEDIKYNYSDSKEVGNYINNNINNQNAVFVASHTPLTSSIIPYTKLNKFYSPHQDKFFTFITWDIENENQNKVPIEVILNNTNNKFKNDDDIYFIYCYNWSDDDLEYFIRNTYAVEIFRSEMNPLRESEKYVIYKLYNS